MRLVKSQYYRVQDRHNPWSRGNPRGLVVLEIADNTVAFGWSLCHDDDQFNRNQARAIASERLRSTPVKGNITNLDSIAKAISTLPHTLRPLATHLVGREMNHLLVSSVDQYVHAVPAK